MSDDKIRLVLCWHMHQPNYFDTAKQQYILPWTYLHIIKDYVDMAAHLESNNKACAVVNFAPVLLEQIDDYAQQISNWASHQAVINDPLLSALAEENVHDCQQISARELLKNCLRANEERLIDRYDQFKELALLAKVYIDNKTDPKYISEAFLGDLLVWYHLAWMGETVKRENELLKSLISKGCFFSKQDRHDLLKLIGELSASVIDRYRRLAESGQVELSFTPYTHPIIPLLLDFNTAREAAPEMPLPVCPSYPGGQERTVWHFQQGVKVFEQHFGFKPSGCWPSEGSVSDETLQVCHDMNVRWVATGESVLRNSLQHTKMIEGDCIHRAYQLKDIPVKCFFRDDGLSDQIGFNYAKWHADDAVSNLVHHIENIAEACPDRKNAVISIILDGENAWEYYPENAYHFLSAMYDKLTSHDNIELTTFSRCIDDELSAYKLPSVVAGSWVYGTFSTWLGDQEKNHAWDLLCDAKHAFDNVMASNTLNEKQSEQATKQLAVCEGSDWFWWFGDYNPSDSVKDFDDLYRKHLKRLYQLLQLSPPEILDEVISKGGGAPAAGGVMRHGS